MSTVTQLVELQGGMLLLKNKSEEFIASADYIHHQY